MKRFASKSELVAKCKDIQLKLINTHRLAMDEAQQSANEYGAPKDRYDSYRMQLLRKKDMHGQMLAKAVEELKVLDKINAIQKLDKVGFGSVVITDEYKYFIAIGAGKITIEDDIYFAVSPKVPLYQAMSGKKKGDLFEFQSKKINILDVF